MNTIPSHMIFFNPYCMLLVGNRQVLTFFGEIYKTLSVFILFYCLISIDWHVSSRILFLSRNQ